MGRGEEGRMVLLMMGQDDSLLSASLNKPAVPSDIDVSSWRNHGSRRPPFLHWDVSERVAVFGHAVSDVLLTPRRYEPRLDDRSLPRLLGSLLPSGGPKVCVVPNRLLHRMARPLSRGSVAPLAH